MATMSSAAMWSSYSPGRRKIRDYGAACKPRNGGIFTGRGLRSASLSDNVNRKAEKKMAGHILVLSQKRANLLVKRDKLVKLPEWATSGGPSSSFGSFLRNSEGMESVLNTKSLNSMENLGDNMYRCTLPPLEFMGIQVAPVLDLYVASSETDCIVEMISCKFKGSEDIERQNERFSASMKNHITWDADRTVNVHVEVKLSLEIYTFPFTHLPVSAVEGPGHALLQACLDKMMPAFTTYLLEDYRKWVEKESTDGHVSGLGEPQETRVQNASLPFDKIPVLALSSEID